MAKPVVDLTGKAAVVLGGTSGIGKSIALGLADAGADRVGKAYLPHEIAHLRIYGWATLTLQLQIESETLAVPGNENLPKNRIAVRNRVELVWNH